MTIGKFAVTAGYANLFSGGMMTLTTGTTTGDMLLRTDNSTNNAVSDSTTNMALGNLTSSAGKIDANAAKGFMTFATLRAATGIKLKATKSATNGQAINGTALYVSNGDLDLFATTGSITMATLSGTKASVIKTNSGSIKISSILGFSSKSLLTLTPGGGGTTTVPVAYR
jgi:hypothetical protein